MPPKQRRIKTECSTMGHNGCIKLLEFRDGRWVVVRINHKVYGRIISETF